MAGTSNPSNPSKISGKVYQSGQDGSTEGSFTVPGLPTNEKYWLKVSEETGEIEVWNANALGDARVGVYNPTNKSWAFNEGFNGSSAKEREIFSQSGATNLVLEKGQLVVQEDLIKDGVSPGEAITTSETLMDTQSETIIADRVEMSGVFNQAINGKIDARKGTRDSNFGTHKYPEDLADQNQDMIQFDVLKYVPNKLKQDTGSFATFEENRGIGDDLKGRKPIGSVFLPIPGGIRDDQTVDWGEGRMNPVEAAAANVALKFLTGQDAVGEVGKIGEQLKARQNEVAGGLSIALSQAAVGGSGGLLTRQTGAIMNPNMELLFKSPQLRPFQFAFQLTPRSRKEATTVMKIIRLFKQAMAPIRSDSMLFLKSPHTFRIKYLTRGKKTHPYIGGIKECALLSLGVDYTPDQNYSTYEDGVMTSYQIQMQFKELEPVYNDDYGSAGDLPGNLDWDAGSADISPEESGRIEREENEWGPDGQLSASEQMALYNASLAQDNFSLEKLTEEGIIPDKKSWGDFGTPSSSNIA